MSEQQDELEVTGPGGTKIRARGYDLLVVIAVVGIALIAYQLWEHKLEAKASQQEVSKSLDRVAQSQEELSYLVSLTAEERARLKLEMPDSLRKRLRER